MIKAPLPIKPSTSLIYNNSLLSYVILLRFGTLENPNFSKPILNYISIAKLIKKPVTTIIMLIKAGIRAFNHAFNIDQPN